MLIERIKLQFPINLQIKLRFILNAITIEIRIINAGEKNNYFSMNPIDCPQYTFTI